MTTSTKNNIGLALVPLGLAALATLCGCSMTEPASEPAQESFNTPEAAVAAIGDVAGTGDRTKWDEIFGANSAEILDSGDDVADRSLAVEVKALIQEKVAFEDLDESTKVALLGNEAWPLPIPLVNDDHGWRFDTEAGREEIENRRIGLNELETLATLHAVVDAQREYFAGEHDGRTGVYAKHVISSEGTEDGLYWPAPDGAPTSPIGPLLAAAASEGYSIEAYSSDNPQPAPYHGYFYRMLLAQGPNAPGGAKSFIDPDGAMTNGFAMFAWPARHGSSGLMTFIVDEQGIVFQKDLEADTSAAAQTITAFDPDGTWHPTGD